MRISDWSSDVCSSDLIETELGALADRPELFDPAQMAIAGAFVSIDRDGSVRVERGFVKPEDEPEAEASEDEAHSAAGGDARSAGPDRKSVVSGKSVVVRVALGGGRSIKKKKKK